MKGRPPIFFIAEIHPGRLRPRAERRHDRAESGQRNADPGRPDPHVPQSFHQAPIAAQIAMVLRHSLSAVPDLVSGLKQGLICTTIGRTDAHRELHRDSGLPHRQ